MQSASFSKSSDGYRVPRRFSVAEILVLTTVFALLFGGLRGFGAPATLYLFLGSQAVVICLVQMWLGEVPRGASAVVGALFLPLWIGTMAACGGKSLPAALAQAPIATLAVVTVVCGGLLGYFTGALAAGVFLVMDVYDNRTAGSFRRRKSAE